MNFTIRRRPVQKSIFTRSSSTPILSRASMTSFASNLNNQNSTQQAPMSPPGQFIPSPQTASSDTSSAEEPSTTRFVNAAAIQDANAQADVQFAAKLQVGLKLKIFIMASVLITTSAIILNSVTNGILLNERSKPDPFQPPTPMIDLPTSQLTSPTFKVWEYSAPQENGAPYVDYALQEKLLNFKKIFDQSNVQQSETVDSILPLKHEERRSTAPTTASPTTTTAEPVTSTEKVQLVTSAPEEHFPMPFKNFACNILNRHWLCSKNGSSFCVFFSSAVTPSPSIVVAPIVSAIDLKDPMDKALYDFKCKGKVRVQFVRASLIDS